MADLRNQGLSYSSIAKQLNTTRSLVVFHISPGLKDKQNAYQRKRRAIKKLLKVEKSKFTDEQKLYISENYLTLPISHIARTLNIPVTTFRTHFNKLGLIIPDELKRGFKTAHKAVKLPIKEITVKKEVIKPKKQTVTMSRIPKPIIEKKRDKDKVFKTKPIDNTGKVYVLISEHPKTWALRNIAK
ncbi:MAG: hypothetical protein P4L31_07645 [Candidatus Babeliales bacterium]|nr:hypothetical protein [Candidatus Babeliales bacterium]